MLPLFFAQQGPTGVPGLDIIGGTVLGAVLILLLFGWLWAKPAVDDLREENKRLNALIDRKDSELAALRVSIDERVIPAIEKNTHLADRVIDLIESRVTLDRRLTETLDRLEGRT